MADPAAPTPQTPPAPGAPPAAPAAPAAAAPPAAPAAPAAPARAAAPAPKRPGNVDDIQFDKHPKLLKRLRQEAARQAARLVQEKLGVSLEEAVDLVKKAGASIDGAPAAGGAPPAAAAPAPGSDREKRVLERRVAKLTARAEQQKRRIVSTKKRARDEVVELELRMDALRVGITDEQADFALWQYRRAAQAAADPESIPDPRPFFEGMRKTHPQIFASAAPAPAPVTLRPTSAPPASRAPGQELPEVAPSGGAPPQVDAFKMTDEQFRRHKQGYGLR